MRALWLLLLMFSAFNVAHAEVFSGKVIAVLDGDTVLIQRDSRNSRPLKVRLAEIDAPEKAQEYGMASRQSLSELVLKKMVQVNSRAVDDYGRLVAHLVTDGRSVNEEQVRRGMAWEYSNHHGNKAYIALQNEAHQASRGLWAQASPTPPWQWRKSHAAIYPQQRMAARDYSCGTKRYCAQMGSCDEAHFYLTHCGVKTLDHDGDGVPCESLCAEKK